MRVRAFDVDDTEKTVRLKLINDEDSNEVNLAIVDDDGLVMDYLLFITEEGIRLPYLGEDEAVFPTGKNGTVKILK